MEDYLKKMEDNLKKGGKRPQKRWKTALKKNKKRPQAQFKINLSWL
jgi:hypothetical protein